MPRPRNRANFLTFTTKTKAQQHINDIGIAATNFKDIRAVNLAEGSDGPDLWGIMFTDKAGLPSLLKKPVLKPLKTDPDLLKAVRRLGRKRGL